MDNDIRMKEILKKSYDKIKELQDKVNTMEKPEPIAVIGMSCKFPGGANSPEKYWDILKNKVETLQVMPADRWNIDDYYDPDNEKPNGISTKCANFVDDIDKFDCSFFGITPKEAEAIDPQHRLLLEVSWHAFENSGLDVQGLRGSKTGVFVGITGSEYLRYVLKMNDESKMNNPYFSTGLMCNAACGRLSYFYDFNGPSIAVDTACSSSLISVDMAVKNLREKQCNLALAGGVSALIVPDSFSILSKINGISKDGRCKTFDASADGYGRGEGCGFIVLKRLKDAIDNNDNILAVIRGSAVGHDGKSNGIAAPNGLSQEKVIQSALEESGLTVDDIDYIEAHGTGTPLGDPIEVHALDNVYRRKKEKLLIGAVKTNFGHLEAASGIASIIKVILSMQNEMIPSNLHFHNPNPIIDWDRVNLEVANELLPWKKNRLKAAGISSLGITGTIGHIILQEYKQSEQMTENRPKQPYGIFTLSAKNGESTLKMLELYKDYFENTDANIMDVCYTSNISRSSLSDKIAFVGKDKKDFLTKISRYLEKYSQNNTTEINNKKVVFLFTGQGSHYKDICKELYDTHPYFKELLNTCDKEFEKHMGESIIDIMYNNDNEDIIYQTRYAQPIIFSIEYALAKLWMSWGVIPSMIIGHSIGEYAAGCIAGVFTLEDAVYMVSKRGQVLSEVDGKGKMLGVLADKETVTNLIEEYKEQVSIAAVNGVNNITISGDSDAIDAIAVKAKKARIFVEKLKISVPFHSVMLSSYVSRYKEMIQHVAFHKPQISMISIRNGVKTDLSDIHFWSSHIREPISFLDAIKVAEENQYQMFLEIGGNATLSALGSESYGSESLFLPSLRKDTDCWSQILASVKELYSHGVNINWRKYHKPYSHKIIWRMPLYQFEKKRYWIESTVKKNDSDLYKDNNEYSNVAEVHQDIVEQNPNLKDNERILSELKEFLCYLTGMEVDDIDTDKELFELGLDSLMMTQLRRKIKEVYSLDIDLNTFFVELRTLEKIAKWVCNNQVITIEHKKPEIKTDDQALTTIENHEQIAKTLTDSQVPSDLNHILSEQIKLMNKQLETLQLYLKQEHVSAPSASNSEKDTFLNQIMNVGSDRNQSIDNMLYALDWEENLNFLKEIKNRTFDISGKTFIFFVEKSGIADNLISYCEKQNAVCITVKNGEEYKELNNHSYQINADSREDYEKLFNNLNIEEKSYIVYLWGIDGINQFPEHLPELTDVFRLTYTSLLYLIKTVLKLKIQNKLKLWLLTQNVNVPNYDHTLTNSLSQATIWGFGRGISMEQNALWGGMIDLDDEVYKVCPEAIIKFILSEKEDEVSIRNQGDFYFPRIDKIRDFNTSREIEKAASYLITGGTGGLGLLIAEFLVKKEVRDIILVSRNKPTEGVQEAINRIKSKHTNITVMQGDVSVRSDMDKIVSNISNSFHPLKGIFHCAGCIDDGMLMAMDWGKINNVFNSKVCGAINLHYLTSTLDLDFFTMFSSISCIGSIGQSNYAAANNFLNALAEYRRREGMPALSINWGPWYEVGMQKTYPGDYLESEGIYGIRQSVGLDILDKLLFSNIKQPFVIDVDWETYMNFLPERRCENIFLYFKNNMICSETPRVERKQKYEIYPMSSVQKRIFTLSQIKERELSYHITNIINLEGTLDIIKLKTALSTLVKRHEAFRTGFHVKNKKFIQTVYEDTELDFKITNADEDHLNQTVKDSIYSFKLDTPPLMHVNLIQLENQKYTLVLDYHHIIVDGFSLDILTEEFIKLYNDISLSKVDKYYKNYISWENKYLLSDSFKQQEQFWEKQIMPDLPLLNLPLDYPRGSIQGFEGKNMYFKIDKEKVDKLKDIARDTNTSLYMIMLAVLDILLYYLTYQDDIVVGSPVAIRNYEFDNVIGMFTNTVLFRNKVNEEMSFIEFLNAIKENCLQVYANQEYPFENMVSKVTTKRDLSHNPMFDIMFAFENTKNREFSFNNLTLKRENYEHDKTMFDLLFAIQNEPDFMNIGINYCTNLFKQSTIERWYRYYESILDIVIKDQGILIKDINYLPERETVQLVSENNLTCAAYSEEKLMHQLFEDRVLKNPDNIAVIFNDKHLSYSELNKISNKLGYEIRKLTHSKEKIAIIINRSIEMIVGVLGILKAGSSYVPIEADIPKDRIKYILEVLNINTIITDSENAIKLQDIYNDITNVANIIILDKAVSYEDELNKYIDKNIITYSNFEKNEFSNLPVITTSDDLAYTIFTSGTTGRPKGVIVKHKPAINLIEWVNKTYHVSEKDKLLFITSLSFDLSVYDIFGMLAAGGQIRIAAKEEIKDPKNLLDTLINEKITFWDSAPPALQLLVPFLPKTTIKESFLRLVFLSGDWIPVSLPDKIRGVFPNSKIVSLGGATEAVIWSNYYNIGDVPAWWTSIPYGKPIQNAKYYILDKKLRVCPVGVAGDLYIGGDCLAEGYTDPELTRVKFIQSPFDENKRIYDTGDMARWLEDGNIELLGRKDSQVKIRGFRIELGEIEAVLKEYDAISNLVVLAKEVNQKEKKIIAYYTIKQEFEQSNIDADLRNYLKGKLPEYMIPAYFVMVDDIPLTSNGKVDRNKLPMPEQNVVTTNYLEPRNQTEKSLVAIWEEILGRKNIGIGDDFFELGGNSMNLISLASKMYDDLGIEIPIVELFSNPTIKGIASHYTDNILSHESEKAMVLLNKENKKKIFFFPDLVGIGAVYTKIASLFDQYAFYAFNYIEEDDRIDQYVDMILQTDDSCEYLLMGYSAGGCLAFDVAKELEQRGKKVSDIIMVDGYKNKTKVDVNEEQKEGFLKQLESNINRHYVVGKMKDKLIDRALKYYVDYMNTDSAGQVSANIHLITSEDRNKIFKPTNDEWNNSTTGTYTEYCGAGPHMEMLFADCAKVNMNIIFSILNSVEEKRFPNEQ